MLSSYFTKLTDKRDYKGRLTGKRAWKPVIYIPLFIAFFFALLSVKNPPIIDEYIETLLVDYRFMIRNILSPPPVPDNILIVFIDEKSLVEYGRWPWSRKLQAELIDKILAGKPQVAAVDIFYPDSESAGADSTLAAVFNKYKGRVVIALGFDVEKGKEFHGEIEDVLYDYTISRIENHRYLDSFKFKAHRVFLPPGPIAGSAILGHAYYLPDRDGKVRLENTFIEYGGEYFPSLAIQTACIAGSVTPDRVSIIGGIGIDLGGLFIPTDESGRMHVNYTGRSGSIAHISAADVLSNRLPAEIFRDKIVFIGTSGIATYDRIVTSFSANMPGVEKNATVVANIINRDFIKKPGTYIDLLIVLLTGVTALLINRRKKVLHTFFLYAFLTVIFIAANQIFFTYYALRINFIYPVFTILTIGTFTISYRYIVEEKSAREIKRIFSNYVTERVVRELIKNPEMAKLGGVRKEITVLFTDVRDFTEFSEKHSPEEVVAMLNDYLGAMTEVIFRWEGTLDKFVGDEILAFWGAPLRQDNHAELALRCAIQMTQRLEELNHKWRAENKPVLRAGIGINTGEVIVGNIGAEGKKMDYTVIGDHVNIGARAEKLTKEYNAQILMTEFTMERIKDIVAEGRMGTLSIKGLGKIKVKGRDVPVTLYEVKTEHGLQ